MAKGLATTQPTQSRPRLELGDRVSDPEEREFTPETSARSVAGYLSQLAGEREAAQQATLVRDIIGNPFRPVKFSPAWRTTTAVAIARQMYESRDFGAMPILADALQDAGCDTDDILTHCRDPQATHVRGCWVIDLVLGKS